jgi:hypothetical protein
LTVYIIGNCRRNLINVFLGTIKRRIRGGCYALSIGKKLQGVHEIGHTDLCNVRRVRVMPQSP